MTNITSCTLARLLFLLKQEPVSCCLIDTIPVGLFFKQFKKNRMKRIFMLMSFVSAAMMSQAAVSSVTVPSLKDAPNYFTKKIQDENKSELKQETPINKIAETCTVILKGTVNGGLFSVEVSCSSTASTCDQATVKAANCLNAAIKKARQLLL